MWPRMVCMAAFDKQELQKHVIGSRWVDWEREGRGGWMVSPNNVATYGVLCALSSFDRQELQSHVIGSRWVEWGGVWEFRRY
jgi:hypothetical protein